MNKIIRTLILSTMAIVALSVFNACDSDSSDSKDTLDRQSVNKLTSQITSELQNIDTDSISGKVIYLQPSVTVNNAGSNDTGYDHKIIGIICVFFVPTAAFVITAWLLIRARIVRRRDKYALIRYAIDHGSSLPDSFYQKPQKSRLQSGISWVGFGLAIILLGLITDEVLSTIGTIPLFIGIARVITYFVEDRKNTLPDTDKSSSQNAQQD